MKEGFALLLLGWLLVTVAFFAITVPMGGTAQNGKVQNGHFFIGQHGKYREVSRTTYVVSAVGTWFWVFYLFLVCVCGVFQTADEGKRPHWVVSLLTRLLFILLVGAFTAVMSYETFTCIRQATGGP